MENYKNGIMKFNMFIVMLSFLFACNKEALEPNENSRTKSDKAYYSSLMASRDQYKGEPFDILEVKRNGEILEITLEGPCDTKGYEVVWDGIVNFNEPTFSAPFIANLIIAYDSKSQIQCLAIMKHTIELNLIDFLGKNVYTKDTQVRVSNASKQGNKIIDSNGIVSFENSLITDKTSQEDDKKYLNSLYEEIMKLAKNEKCTASDKFLLTAFGDKPCGGPAGYLIYSSTADEKLLLIKVATYNAENKIYNQKNGAISDCAGVAKPIGVECKNGMPELVY